MEREIFPKLAEKGQLYGHIIQGLWMDIGKPEEYLQTNRILLDALPKQTAKKSKAYEIDNPVALDKGVSIGKKSIIGPYAILGKNVTVGESATIRNSVIFPETKIEDHASIEGAIIGEAATIGKKVKIGKGCVIADQAKIKQDIFLDENIVVCPAKEVTEKTLKSKIIC
jgi:NDP-sugar pyrophosphorylase family protein